MKEKAAWKPEKYSVPAQSPTAMLFESEMSVCAYFLPSEESNFLLGMTLLGHYLTRCTWTRNQDAYGINYWVISGPGPVSGYFPGISIPQLSSYFGSKPKQQENSVMCVSCQDCSVHRKWNLSQSMLMLSVGCRLWRTLFFLLDKHFLAMRYIGIIPNCSLRAK